jgi:hypothetical protein
MRLVEAGDAGDRAWGPGTVGLSGRAQGEPNRERSLPAG